MNALSSVLTAGNAILSITLPLVNTVLNLEDTYSGVEDPNRTSNNYRRIELTLSKVTGGMDIFNTVSLGTKAIYSGSKLVQASLPIVAIGLIIRDPQKISRKEKIIRIALNALHTLRLLFEMQGHFSFYSICKLKPLDPIWYTLIAFELSARLFLLDQRRPKFESV